jgi:hypothetical protein
MPEAARRRYTTHKFILFCLCTMIALMAGCTGGTVIPPDTNGPDTPDQTPGSITGRVVDSSITSTGISGASIDAYVYTPPSGSSTSAAGRGISLLRQSGDTSTPSGSATSQSDGSYSLSGLAPQKYEIKINPPQGTGYQAIIIRITVPAGAEIEFEITLITSDSAESMGGIDIEPEDQSVAPGSTIQYTAAVTDQDGNPLSLTPIWSVDGGVGTIDANGLFTAGSTAGYGQIKAQVGDRTAITSVKVGSPEGGSDNNAPQFDEPLYVEPAIIVRPGTYCLIGAFASDPDDDDLCYTWGSSNNDEIWPSWAPEVAEWSAPNVEGFFDITCRIEDPWGASATATTQIEVSNNAPNSAPVIEEIFTSSAMAPPGGDLFVECWAYDPDPDDNWDLGFAWSASAGTITPDEYEPYYAVWSAPTALGDYDITCTVTDRHGASTQETRTLGVGGSGFDVTVKGQSR